MVRGNFWKFRSFPTGQKFSHLVEIEDLVHVHSKPFQVWSPLLYCWTDCDGNDARLSPDRSQVIVPCHSFKTFLSFIAGVPWGQSHCRLYDARQWWVSAPPGGDAAEVCTLPDDRAATWWRILAGRTWPRLPVRHTGESHPTKQHVALEIRDGRYRQVLPQVLRRTGEWSPYGGNARQKIVFVTKHWGPFAKPLLPWKSKKYYVFWVCVCSYVT